MTVIDHVKASNRARAAMDCLEKHPSTSRSQLGAARDRVNQTHNLNRNADVWGAVYALDVRDT